MSQIIKLISIFFVLLNLQFCVYGVKSKTNRPNFIIIYTDDQRYDALGANNNEVIITPSIDEIAKKGIRFTNANVVFALCSPSRAALLTGRYGSANGVLELNSKLNEGEVSLANYLKEAGYQTGMSGKWHINQSPQKLGFDFYSYFYANGTYYGRKIINMNDTVYPKIHCDEYCVDRSIEFLKKVSKQEDPFFLYHNTQLPHMNGNLIWDAKESTLAKYDADDMPVAATRLDDLSEKPEYLKNVRNRTKSKDYGYPDARAIQKHTKEYYSVITELDDALGRLFSTFEKLGLYENTYILFMGDNGWMLGEHGFTSKVLPYRPSTKVPFFIIGPGIQSGSNDNILLNIDLAPTILELAGIQINTNIHGKSLVPIINKQDNSLRDCFVYEGLGLYGGAKPNLSVISDEYRLIVTYEDKSLQNKIFEELYDQKNDPIEMNNLANNPEYLSIKQKLITEIDNHKKKILNIQ